MASGAGERDRSIGERALRPRGKAMHVDVGHRMNLSHFFRGILHLCFALSISAALGWLGSCSALE